MKLSKTTVLCTLTSSDLRGTGFQVNIHRIEMQALFHRSLCSNPALGLGPVFSLLQ